MLCMVDKMQCYIVMSYYPVDKIPAASWKIVSCYNATVEMLFYSLQLGR